MPGPFQTLKIMPFKMPDLWLSAQSKWYGVNCLLLYLRWGGGLVVDLGWLMEVEGAEERRAAFWDRRFPVCTCSWLHEVLYSEHIINKWWAACSANICSFIGSYFLFLSNIVNRTCIDQGRTVELSSPESTNHFQPLDEIHGSVKHRYK